MNERNQSNDLHSLSHTKWNCKYHVVFAPKYRRAVFYDSKRIEIGKILRELCEWKGVNIVEAEVCKDHVHMLLEIPRSRTYAVGNTAKNEHIRVHGLFERKKQSNDI